jgi:hypothetical protein
MLYSIMSGISLFFALALVAGIAYGIIRFVGWAFMGPRKR